MRYKWLSFSLNGENQGVCNIEASSQDEALKKCQDLGIVPTHDDILILSISRPELPLNKLIPRTELMDLSYKSYTLKRQ